MRAVVVAGAAAVVAVAALTACGEQDAAAPDGLRATVEQSRDNENRRLLQLVLHNDGDADVHVRRVELDSPGYARARAVVFDDRVRPGSRTAFPVPYGEVDCERDPDGTAVLAWLEDGGRVQQVRLPVPDDDPFLPRLHARDCALEEVRDAVDVSLDGLRRDGDVVVGELALDRGAGDRRVRLTDLQSSILFLLQATGPLPLELPAGRDRAAVAVQLRPVRCDPHALIESKRSHTFPLFVALDEQEPLQLPVTADDAGKALLDELLREYCRGQGVDLG